MGHSSLLRLITLRLLPTLGAVGAGAAERVVINEIHFQPAEKKPLEFIELHNAGDQPAVLAGWMLDKFRFAPGTEIAAGAYLVIARDPVAVEKEFGSKALGPFPGKLSNEGEKLTLKNAAGKVVEQVRYGAGFPWPSGSAGAGSSLERVHPLLAAAEPGSWRASGYPVATAARTTAYLASGSAQWRWRKGTSEASQPAAAWRARDFREGGDWQTGKAGFGYGDNDDATVLGDMANQYASVFLRHRFQVDRAPASLLCRVKVDDGCIVWLNGQEVARWHMPAGEPKFDSLAEDHEAEGWEEKLIPEAARYLAPGENVLAVQVFNSSRDSSDLSFDLSLEDAAHAAPAARGGKRPTPGAPNTVRTAEPLPSFSSVWHSPQQPKPGDSVRVTAQLSGAPARQVVLHAQWVEPGAYVRKTDAEYETRWEHFSMRAEGNSWVFDLPAAQQINRRLVRYRITAEMPNGLSVRVPYADDPAPNFAYYVWAGPPPWTGAPQPGKTPPFTFGSDFQRTLPTFTLIANQRDVTRSQWDGGVNHQKFLGTFIYEGRVLDHMEFNNRGSASTYQNGKNKWGFHFLPTHDLPMRDQWGRPYATPWNSFAMNGCACPWVQINRGMAGLDEAVSFRAYQLAGVPASDCLPVHFRVVCTPEEQGRTQYEGDLWGLYQAIESTDGRWLENKHLPDGVIYKPEDGIKFRPGEMEKSADKYVEEFTRGPRGKSEQWWREHLDLPAYYSFHAINRLVSNVDLRHGANHAFYRHPERNWQPVPWDLDMQFIPRTHQAGLIDQTACLREPALKIEYQNRAREILDLLGSDPSPHGGQIGQLVAEYARLIEPPSHVPGVVRGGPEWSWATLDMCRWNYAPSTNDKGAFYRNPAEQLMMGGPFTRRLATPDFAGFCRYVVEFCTDSRPQKDYRPNDGNPLGYGYGHLLSECRDPEAPATPTIRQISALTFTASPFADAQGTDSLAAIQWRVAEVGQRVSGPWKYELEPLWISHPLPGTATTHTFPSGLYQNGRTYRFRARYQDKTGRWSHWSAPIQAPSK